MKTKTVGFIGAGRITRIFLEGWKRQNAFPPRVVVADEASEILMRLKTHFTTIEPAPGNNAFSASQDIVFLAIHPPVVGKVAGEIKTSLRPDTIVVSLAPKWTIARLVELLGGFSRLARVIPNAPSVINFGFNPICFGPGLSPEDKSDLLDLLRPLGESPEVQESKLEAYALLTAMGPTYLWFQLQTLREIAVGFGLTEEEVAPALKRMVCGSTRTLLEGGLPPADLMDLIPVKPLAEMEPQVSEMYRTRLPALLQKIKP